VKLDEQREEESEMKYLAWAVFFLPLGLICALCLVGGLGDDGSLFTAVGFAAEKSGGLPPLVVERDAPLKLKDVKPVALDPWGTPPSPVADNLACHCCHANYKEETLAVVHAKANIGCVKCHGKSPEHRADEDNITPPDTMYPVDKINKACSKCHDSHDVSPAKIVARWEKCASKRLDAKKIVCTDCHGNHRLKVRTVRWEKDTGNLIIRKVKVKPEKDTCPKKK
jgi:hypothetical protein